MIRVTVSVFFTPERKDRSVDSHRLTKSLRYRSGFDLACRNSIVRYRGVAMTEKHLDPDVEDTAAIQGRRRLLRAAAAIAPLVATLPNGASAANASTAQCIVTSRNPNTPPAPVAATPDGFVRQFGREVKVGLTVSNDPDSYIIVYTINGETPLKYYRSDGSVWSTGLPSDYQEKSVEAKALLRYFDAAADDTNVENCAPISAVPNCIFPVAQPGTARNNQPLFTSCLNSVNPGLLTP